MGLRCIYCHKWSPIAISGKYDYYSWTEHVRISACANFRLFPLLGARFVSPPSTRAPPYMHQSGWSSKGQMVTGFTSDFHDVGLKRYSRPWATTYQKFRVYFSATFRATIQKVRKSGYFGVIPNKNANFARLYLDNGTSSSLTEYTIRCAFARTTK